MLFDGDTGLIPLLGFTTLLCSLIQQPEPLPVHLDRPPSSFQDPSALTLQRGLQQLQLQVFPV